MKGKYDIVVKNRRLQYKFSIERNITILQGESATGKTTLIEMIAAYQLNGKGSGITVECKKTCTVLSSLRWQENLSVIHDCIVFIDEGDKFVLSEEFARAVKNSDNYYVIASRAFLPNLPYSVNEIYGIRNTTGNYYQGTRRMYAQFHNLYYDGTKVTSITRPDLVIVEDAKAGFQFFSNLFSRYHIPCLSAKGKSNIYQELLHRTYSTALVIADGAAFGPEIERVLSLERFSGKELFVYLPESFEWMILKSGLLKRGYLQDILENPYDYIESEKYFSWERFFSALLMNETSGTYLHYDKASLNPSYINAREQAAIVNVMPELAF